MWPSKMSKYGDFEDFIKKNYFAPTLNTRVNFQMLPNSKRYGRYSMVRESIHFISTVWNRPQKNDERMVYLLNKKMKTAPSPFQFTRAEMSVKNVSSAVKGEETLCHIFKERCVVTHIVDTDRVPSVGLAEKVFADCLYH